MKVRLLDIAHARSGDKGDTANVGVIALEPRWYVVLDQFVTQKSVAEHFRGMIEGSVDTLVFNAYCEQVLQPTLKRGDVIVLDNLGAHRASRCHRQPVLPAFVFAVRDVQCRSGLLKRTFRHAVQG